MIDRVEKIQERVYRIPAYFAGVEVSLYLLLGERTALIDTGVSSSVPDYIEPALRQLNLKLSDIDYVINTHGHPDHLGGNGAVKRASGAEIMLHRGDASFAAGPDGYMSSPYDLAAVMRKIGRENLVNARRQDLLRYLGETVGVDRWLRDGDPIDLGQGVCLEVKHTPGHTAGGVCLYWEREAMLFSGDSLQGRGVFPGWLPFYFHAANYIRSAAMLSGLPLATLCLGHAYQTGLGVNHPVRRGQIAVKTAVESLETAEMIESKVSAMFGAQPPRDLTEFTLAVLSELQYDLPVMLDRALGAPAHSLATINAHIENQQGGA